jgi:hypothetical protein
VAGRKTDKTVALLQLLGRLGGKQEETGLYIVEVKTSDPDPVTFVMRGTQLALGTDIFEIPVNCYPLREGDELFALQLAGGHRWGILAKINGGAVMATWDGNKVQPDGMTASYDALAPAGLDLAPGDRVSIAPTRSGSHVSYVILNKY